MQQEVLQKFLEGHQDIQRCCLHANILIWEPGISKQTRDTIAKCPTCMRESFPHKEPLISFSVARIPMAKDWN